MQKEVVESSSMASKSQDSLCLEVDLVKDLRGHKALRAKQEGQSCLSPLTLAMELQDLEFVLIFLVLLMLVFPYYAPLDVGST